MQEQAVSATVDWLVQAAMAGKTEGELLQGIRVHGCSRRMPQPPSVNRYSQRS